VISIFHHGVITANLFQILNMLQEFDLDYTIKFFSQSWYDQSKYIDIFIQCSVKGCQTNGNKVISIPFPYCSCHYQLVLILQMFPYIQLTYRIKCFPHQSKSINILGNIEWNLTKQTKNIFFQNATVTINLFGNLEMLP